MNRRNNWEQLLAYANEEVASAGYEIRIVSDEDGCYDCNIYKNGRKTKTYAQNYYEDELADLVTEVWHYVAKNARRCNNRKK
jgi:hypothetical protein